MSRDNNHHARHASRRDVLKAGAAAAGVGAGLSKESEVVYANQGEETTVTIKRDEYGVPHIYARNGENRAPTFFGYGYATARDRLYQLELYRRYYHGSVSAVLGDEWVEFDQESRRNTAGEPSLADQIDEQLTGDQKRVLGAFTEGINRYIRDVREGDDREFARGFQEAGFEPEEFSPADTAAMFVASMAFFSGFQLETLGAAVVGILQGTTGDRETAMDIFSDANWVDDPGSPTSSIQSEEGYWPPWTDAETGETETYEPQERITPGEQNLVSNQMTGGNVHIPDNATDIHHAEVERKRTVAQGLRDLGLAFKYGSYALTVHADVTESGDSLLMGGPQMEFSTPSVMYEAGLHGPDFDVSGITVAGYPFIMFGHNNHGAFTSTAGIDNCLQMFDVDVTVNENGPDTYEFRGQTDEIQEVEKTIEVAGGEDVTYTERFTRHGVVTQWNPGDGQAVVETRSYAGRHMNCWRAFYECQFAETVDEYGDAARRCDYALNFLWAGTDDDIGYFHLGRYPDFESVEWDTRFPADGNQYELTEGDYRRAADGEVPYSINPPAGYAAGWNNKPAPNWNAGDLNYNYSTDHRVQRIINQVERQLHTEGTVSFDDLQNISEDISFVDLRSIRYKDHLLDALDGADIDSTEQGAKAELEAWGHVGRGGGEDDMGQYPAGYTIWNETFDRILQKIYRPVFGDQVELALVFHGDDYGKGALMRLFNPEETALDVSGDANYGGGDPEGALVEAFRDAVSALDDEFDSGPSEWRRSAAVDELETISLFGVPVGIDSAGEMAQMNRGTEEHFVRLSDDIVGENILPPGNDGYVAPDGSTGPHFDDQLPLFRDFEYKSLLFDDAEVDAATESERTLPSEVPPVAADYTDPDGIVDTPNLRDAIADWRERDISTELLRDVIAAWRSGEQID